MLLALPLVGVSTGASVQAPPATSIEERFIRVEEGQRNLEKRFDDLNRRIDDLRADMNERFAEMNQRLAEMNQRFVDMKGDMNQRFGDMNQRFGDINQRLDDMNRRIGDIMTFLQILVGVLAAVAIGIFGTLLLMWRRLVKVEADVALLSSQFRVVRSP